MREDDQLVRDVSAIDVVCRVWLLWYTRWLRVSTGIDKFSRAWESERV